MADSTVRIGADLSELRRELAKLPNMSGEAAQKTLIKVEKAVQKAERAAKQSTKAISRAQKEAARATEKSSKDATEGLKALFEMAGGSGEQIEKLTKILEGMGSTAVVAGAGVLIVVAAMAAWATGITAVVKGLIDLVAKAEEVEEALEPFRELEGFKGLSPQVWESVQAANSSLEALGTITQQAIQLLGGEFAPLLERVGFLLVKFGLMGLDAIVALTDLHDVARDTGVMLVRGLMVPVQGVVNALNSLVQLMAIAAEAAGLDGLAGSLHGASKAMQQATDAAFLVDSALEGLGAGLDYVSELTGEYDARAHKLIATQTELREETEESAKAVQKLSDAYENVNKATENADGKQRAFAELSAEVAATVAKATRHRMTAMQMLEEAEAQAFDEFNRQSWARIQATEEFSDLWVQANLTAHEERTAIEEEFAQRRIEIAQKEAQAKAAASANYARLASESLMAVGNLADMLFDRRLDQLQEGTEAHKKAAKRQFIVQKALAVAMSIMQGAQAVLSSIATLGPPVPPNFVGIAGVAAAGTIATAGTVAIAAAKPPALHTGGTVGRPAPDEADRRLRMGESVLNARATARMGQEAIDNANAGGDTGGGGSTVVVVEYKNQVLDTQVSDLSRVPGSALRRAIKQGARVGHRSR
jgi:hypothetical protein